MKRSCNCYESITKGLANDIQDLSLKYYCSNSALSALASSSLSDKTLSAN